MVDIRAALDQGESTPDMPLPELLQLLVAPQARTGQITTARADEAAGPRFGFWLDHGRVVAANWGHLRGLSALEMGAVFLPRAQFAFFPGRHSSTLHFDLSPLDLSVRLAQVAHEGAALRETVPGPLAVPAPVAGRRLPNDPEAARLLSRIDGQRTVSDLVEGRQPLVVLRGLARLAQMGAISFEVPEARVGPAPAAASAPPPVSAEQAPREVAPEPLAEPAPPRETLPVPEVVSAEPAAPEAAPREVHRGLNRVPVAAAAAVLVVAMLVGILRAFPPESDTSVQTQPGSPPVAAAPTAAPTGLPTAGPTTAPTTGPTTEPTAAPTSPPTTVPTSAPTAAPTTAPTAAPTSPPTAVPTTAPTAEPTALPTAAPTTLPTAVPASAPLLDQSFAAGAPGWPDSATSSAYWDAAGYHLVPRIASQFVAIQAPTGNSLGNVSVTALFRKAGGPVGGGYGVILRGQGGPFDGTNQGGRFYVFEVGDKGEFGVWRREQTQWVELRGWTANAAVNAGDAENRIDVQASGSNFTFSVNGTQVAQVTDTALASGSVGVFTGGDGNQVLLERFEVAGL